jgi:hypothetical protein
MNKRRVRHAIVGAAVLAALAVMPAGSARAATNGLDVGEQLAAGQSVVSPSGEYQLIMQGDGNLVEYVQGRALWNTGTGGHPGAFAAMQGDGNFVVYAGGTALWNSGTGGHAGATLALQDDANLVVYQGGTALWVDAAVNDKLTTGQQLTAGQYVQSPDRAYMLVMQGDGNLVEYFSGRAIWTSGTQGHPDAFVAMQGDGNLVVYADGAALWNSGTQGHASVWVQLQNDANLVVYNSDSTALWYNGTFNDRLTAGQQLTAGQHLESANRGYRLYMQGDGNLVEYNSAGTALWTSGTQGHPGAFVAMQGDGNLVVYAGGTALWNTATGGHPGAFVAVQSDANLVVYDGGGTAIWMKPQPGGVVGDDYPYRNSTPDVVDPWNFYTRECTSFVAWRMNHQYGIAFTNQMRGGHWGNANQWPANARNLGYAVNGSPSVGAIAEFNI